ncbi:MAG: M20/M25/M40 family metallo-hydrolase [Chitinispirillales bacterium]|nr:M20/M25/M40 family metallo-hydrolase [Chitinispirillales bacterium]
MINENRLRELFLSLVKIKSESKFEADLAKKIEEIFNGLGYSVEFDDCAKNLGGNCSNMVVKIDGDKSKDVVLLSTHLDTVIAGGEIEPVVENDVIKSGGNSILGADDKAGISAVIEAITILKENKINHPPLLLVFSVCEEIGLMGVKYCKISQKDVKYGIVVDAGGKIGTIVNQAPYYNSWTIKIHGKSAHTGIEPQKGINAVVLASKLIKELPTGKISKNSSANIAKINGGTADNIVPDFVEISGEIRSCNLEKINEIVEIYKEAIKKFNKKNENRAEIEIIRKYDGFSLDKNSPLIQKLCAAAKKTGKTPKIISSGGGSDANFFNKKGIPTSVISCGMANVHTHEEYINFSDIVDCTKMILNFISE